MDKHLRLFEMLPEDRKPLDLWGSEELLPGMDYPVTAWSMRKSWSDLPDHVAPALIEHAAMVWLMGQGYAVFDLNGYLDNTIKRTRDIYSLARLNGLDQNYGDTLIDALLAAAEPARDGVDPNIRLNTPPAEWYDEPSPFPDHAREGGEGE